MTNLAQVINILNVIRSPGHTPVDCLFNSTKPAYQWPISYLKKARANPSMLYVLSNGAEIVCADAEALLNGRVSKGFIEVDSSKVLVLSAPALELRGSDAKAI